MFNIVDNEIFLSRGDTCSFDISIVDDEGEPYTPSEGEVLLFSLKKITGQCKTIFTKVFIEDGGDYIVSLDGDDTNDLAFGEYVYDVILYSEGDTYTIVEPTKFTITEVVHNEYTGN